MTLDTDIFSLLNEHSIARCAFQGVLQLSQLELPTFQPDDSYTTMGLGIPADKDTLDYLPAITEICKGGRHTKKHEKLHNAVYEAFRNAYQHGNKKDPSKSITLSWRATADSFEVVVGDQGGEFNAQFVPFVLLHRQGRLKEPVNFYDFTSTAERNPENSGIGTYVIHSVADEVRYFKNSAGGLSVQLIIYGPQLPLPFGEK